MYKVNGKEDGAYCIVFGGYIGILEKNMETTK